MITWIFPECCPVCGKLLLPRGSRIHAACEKRIAPVQEPICKKCGRPIPEETAEYCENCESTTVLWDSGRCLYPYRGVFNNALMKVKQEGTKEFVRYFGTELARQYAAYIKEIAPDYIVPVPLHKGKLRQRGFNQAELLAEELAEQTGIPLYCMLLKQKKTTDQKKLSGEQRKRNLSHAFAIDIKLCQKKKIPHTVLLIDDIFTTGSTMNACATVLKQYGVQNIYFLCVGISE